MRYCVSSGPRTPVERQRPSLREAVASRSKMAHTVRQRIRMNHGIVADQTDVAALGAFEAEVHEIAQSCLCVLASDISLRLCWTTEMISRCLHLQPIVPSVEPPSTTMIYFRNIDHENKTCGDGHMQKKDSLLWVPNTLTGFGRGSALLP